MDHTVLFSVGEIARMVRKVAETLDEAAADPYLVLVVLKGAAIFSSDLVRATDTDTKLAYVTASSYDGGLAPGESVSIQFDTSTEFQDRHVLIVDDIVDTGRTLSELVATVQQARPKRVASVALVNKAGRRTSGFEPTYSGFNIAEELILGHGLDWNQRFRNLPYIARADD